MSLFEEAVIEASKLREAAKRYGESRILEQYAPKIEEAINFILEQDPLDDEDPLASDPSGMGGPPGQPPGGDMGAPGGDMGSPPPGMGTDPGLNPAAPPPEADDAVINEMPLAATEGEQLCSCPDQDEEIEINFDDLTQSDKPTSPMQDENPLMENEMSGEQDQEEEYEFEEGLEEALNSLAEELEVDLLEPNKSGWIGRPSDEMKDAEDQMIASTQDDENKEEFKELQKSVKSLKKENKQIQTKIEKLNENNTIYKKNNDELNNLIQRQQIELKKVALRNVHLFFQNQVLQLESLNRQQKKSLVESINKTKSLEEAKLVFDSLQSSMGSYKKPKPKSLSEVAENNSSNSFAIRSILKERLMEEQNDHNASSEFDDSFKSRMKKLAGIDKTN